MSIIPKTVNPDLEKERQQATFNVADFALWWHGGAENLEFKRELESEVFKEKGADDSTEGSKSYEDIYSIAAEFAIKAGKKFCNLQEKDKTDGEDIWVGKYASPERWRAFPIGNLFIAHFSLVVEVLRTEGTDEQFENFGKRVENFEISISCAVVEFGHHPLLRGLQTRADFDREADEFILNTPTLSSYKWYFGGLGRSCNYSLVKANLYIDKSSKGLFLFIVQLRDENTHLPLPGIDMGNIGKKVGVNNGYLGLKNVRIPRSNMLMRKVQVERDGTMVRNSQTKLSVMVCDVLVRSMISHNSVYLLSMAATIATRYSAVRRQDLFTRNKPEPQLIDYATQQMRLFPEIASSIANKVACDKVWELHNQYLGGIQHAEDPRRLDLYIYSYYMKMLCSSDTANAIARLRLACGGHGSLKSTDLVHLYANATAGSTSEGENMTLLLRVAKTLIYAFGGVKAGIPMPHCVSYMEDIFKNKDFGEWSGSWENIVKALQYAASKKTQLVFEHLVEGLQSGQPEDEAHKNVSLKYTEVAELHGRCFIAATFLEEVTGPKAKLREPSLNKVLEDLLELYLVHIILKHIYDVLVCINIPRAALLGLKGRLEYALGAIRPNAVAICDGFGYHDLILKSTLGSYDGNIYERMFEAIKNSPLSE